MAAAAIVVGINDLQVFEHHPSLELVWLTAGIGIFSLALVILMFFKLDGMKKVHYKSVHLGHVILGLCTLGGAVVASVLEMMSGRYPVTVLINAMKLKNKCLVLISMFNQLQTLWLLFTPGNWAVIHLRVFFLSANKTIRNILHKSWNGYYFHEFWIWYHSIFYKRVTVSTANLHCVRGWNDYYNLCTNSLQRDAFPTRMF